MAKRDVTLALLAGLALVAQPVLARGSRGGGHPGGGRPGGGHPGGGYAVPRGSGPGYVPGGGAYARHPRAGTGYSAYRPPYGHYPAYGHGRYPAYGHGGYYRPYYPYYGGGYYGGYYGPSFGLSFGFGAPYAYGYYGWPYAYPWYPSPAPTTHVYVTPARRADAVPNTGRVRLEVRPEDATVYVDDEFWGTASESRSLTLRQGTHAIEIVRPGYAVERRDVEVVEGETVDVMAELVRR